MYLCKYVYKHTTITVTAAAIACIDDVVHTIFSIDDIITTMKMYVDTYVVYVHAHVDTYTYVCIR